MYPFASSWTSKQQWEAGDEETVDDASTWKEDEGSEG